MSEPQKALIYCRVSDPKQKSQGHGLDSQEHRCREFAAMHNLEVERVFHDDVSGGGHFNKRPAMTALLDHLRQNHKTPYIVVFDDIKRFSRDVYFYWGLIHKLDEFNARPMSPNFVFDKTPEGRFQQSITVAAGEFERESNARQTRQKTQARLEAGYHAFVAPVGFRYVKDKVHGKMLALDPKTAPILKEALEGFASGRFQTTMEVRTFLEQSPEYPKQASGKLGNSKAKQILTNPLYAGYIEYAPWGVSLREGRHEGIISYETFCKIKERLEGRAYAPNRKDLNQDFPLRGAVACECGNALTSGWSKSKTGKLHPYYLCQNRKCDYKGKSVRRDVLEGQFEALLQNISPANALITIADKLFRKAWALRSKTQQARKKMLEKECGDIDNEIEKLVDHIIDAKSALVAQRLEERVGKLEDQKRVLEEKLERIGQPVKTFDQMYRTSMLFLENPNKIWQLGGYAEKRAVLKLVFSERLVWDRKGLYRTPDLSLPFKALGGFFMFQNKMVPGAGIEPARCCHRGILSPLRLPVSPPGPSVKVGFKMRGEL
jgi:site-specific DNA recombinase